MVNKDQLQRRDVLQSIGAGTIGSVAFIGTTKAEGGGKIQKIGGNERDDAISKAITNGKSKRLIDGFDGDLIEDESAMSAYSISAQNNGSASFVLVVGNMRSDEYNDSPTFQWTNNPHAENRVSISVLEDSTESIFTVKNGSVEESEENVEGDIPNGASSNGNDLNIHDNHPDDDDCYRHSEVCTDVNWSCVADLLITYGACSSAVIPVIQKPAAALCVADLSINIEQALNDIGCSTCADTDIQSYNICDEGWDIQPP